MNETEFNSLVDKMLLRIERALESSALNLEFETANGILEIEFDNGTKIIINRQTPNREIWVAARSGGFHFKHLPGTDGEQWFDTRGGKALFARLEDAVSQQAGARADLHF